MKYPISCFFVPVYSISFVSFPSYSNEREGIPANLLQMFDVCVEIPQQGVTRSLNVHVSAALLIWEYTRQHLTSGSRKVNSKPENWRRNQQCSPMTVTSDLQMLS